MQKRAGYIKRYSRLVWLVGLFLMMLNSIVGLVILPFIDMTLLASVLATAIISGVLIGIFWLKEPLMVKYDLPALVLMIVGSLCLSHFSNKTTNYYTMDQMKHMMTTYDA